MQVWSSSEVSAVNLSRATVSISSVGTLLNRLTTSRLTLWLEWKWALQIFSTKWADLPVTRASTSTGKRLNGWHAEPLLLTMGLSGIPSLWILGKPYIRGSLLSAFPLWYDIFILTKYLWQLPLHLQGRVFLYFIVATLPISSANLLSITTVALSLSNGRITMLLLQCNALRTHFSSFEIFDFGDFDFSRACLSNLLGWLSIEKNTIWETLIKKAR